MQTAALVLPGDWSSARLLVRILTTIGSDWDLTEVGLVEAETGAACRIAMGPMDPELSARFGAWEDLAFPSLTEVDREGLPDHKAVVRLTPGEGLVGREACMALLRCGSALVDAGAKGVAVLPSQLAHGPERWQHLAALSEGEAPVALVRAFVRLLVRESDRWTTRGMALLGEREIAVHGAVPEAYAFEVTQALAMRLVGGPGLAGGERMQPGRAGPQLVVRAEGEGWWVERG